MDVVSREAFGTLVDARIFPAISVYMPTHRVGPEIQQDPIRLKNLVGRARKVLVEESDMRGPEADRLLEPIADLVADSDFWQHQDEGLALFLSVDRLRSFRLPVSFEEYLAVGDGFHVKQLLEVVNSGERVYVLALSRQRVRLLLATRFEVDEIDLGEVPTTMSEALQHEDLERQLQFHQSGVRGRGSPTAIFHGQGMGKETAHRRLERFFRTIDRGVAKVIEPDTPLVLAGVEYLLPIYRTVSRHPEILDGEIAGSPDGVRDEELRERVWQIAAPFFDKEKDAALSTYASGAAPTERLIEGVVRAAREGRVAGLFVDPTVTMWGSVVEGSVVQHETHQPGDRDLLDVSVVETWRHGGSVYLGAPEGTVAAAVLRY